MDVFDFAFFKFYRKVQKYANLIQIQSLIARHNKTRIS
jgi:hypothetical protein